MTDFEAYELLPRELRDMLKQSVIDFDAYDLLKKYRKFGLEFATNQIVHGNLNFTKRPWIGKRNTESAIYTPCGTGEVRPLLR